MADPLRVDLFCEDLGHELFCRELLARLAAREGRQIVLGDPMDYAPDLVRAMNLFRAGKAQPSLRHFVADIKAALRGLPG